MNKGIGIGAAGGVGSGSGGPKDGPSNKDSNNNNNNNNKGLYKDPPTTVAGNYVGDSSTSQRALATNQLGKTVNSGGAIGKKIVGRRHQAQASKAQQQHETAYADRDRDRDRTQPPMEVDTTEYRISGINEPGPGLGDSINSDHFNSNSNRQNQGQNQGQARPGEVIRSPRNGVGSNGVGSGGDYRSKNTGNSSNSSNTNFSTNNSTKYGNGSNGIGRHNVKDGSYLHYDDADADMGKIDYNIPSPVREGRRVRQKEKERDADRGDRDNRGGGGGDAPGGYNANSGNSGNNGNNGNNGGYGNSGNNRGSMSPRSRNVQAQEEMGQDRDIRGQRQGQEVSTSGASGTRVAPSALKPESLEYLETIDIQPSANASKDLSRTVAGIDTQGWPEIFHTLNVVRQLVLHHQRVINSSGKTAMHSLFQGVLRCVDNLRSQVAKNAILAVGDMYVGFKKLMDPEVASTVTALLKKSSDSSTTFVASSCEGAMCAVIDHTTPSR